MRMERAECIGYGKKGVWSIWPRRSQEPILRRRETRILTDEESAAAKAKLLGL